MRTYLLPLAFFLVVIYLIFQWKKTPLALVIGSLFFIEIIWQFISIVWIDCGTYISEQLRFSSFTGASFRYIVLISPFIFTYPYFLRKNFKKNKSCIFSFRLGEFDGTRKLVTEKRLFYSVFFLVTYMYLNLLLSGIPAFSEEITKTSFYSTYSVLPFCGIIQNYLFPFFMLFLGINIGNRIKYKRKFYEVGVVVLLIILFQLLMNNKFYGLYDYILHFLLPLLVINRNWFDKLHMKIPWKWLIIILCGFGMLLALSYSKYSLTRENPMQYLLDRLFSLQSHTFWGVDLLLQKNGLLFDFSGFSKELYLSVFSDLSRLDADFGIARVMYIVTPKTYVDDMLATGYLFAGSYLTVLMSYLGYAIPFFFSFALSWIIAKISVLLANYVQTQHYFITFIVFFVFRRYFEFFRVGNLAMIINWKFIVIYLVFFVFWIIKKVNKSRSGNL